MIEREPEESDQLPEEGPGGQAEDDSGTSDRRSRHENAGGADDDEKSSEQPTGNPDAAG